MRPAHDAVIMPRPERPEPVPVEYAVAVDRYLGGASLGPASRRVYRISLTSWAWALVGRRAPRGRRGAAPPVVPLALLEGFFRAVTRPLDPAGRGWTLTQLRQADPAPD